jgi:CubicO group peptidase (beta-lactamase class C family)
MLLALGLLFLALPPVPLPAQPADVAWPTKQWPTGPLPAGVDAVELARLLAVTDRVDNLLGETRAVVLVQRGRLVAERYRGGFGPQTRLISWSMAKSITQSLVGVAARQGKLDPDQPMGNPRWAAGDGRAAISWRQWLQMVDGQAYREIGVSSPAENDAAKMLFGEGRLDAAGYAARLPLVHRSGEHWNYNSAGIILTDEALVRAVAPDAATPDARRSAIRAFMQRELFDRIGMGSAQPEFDASGTFLGSALVYATAQDFARFGLLYLRDGVWEGSRVLPEGWVDFARRPAPAGNANIYGAGFWVAPGDGKPRPPYRSAILAPRDSFQAQGYEGQITLIVPSKDLVLVRLGYMRESGWRELSHWAAKVVSLFPDASTTVTR